MNNGPAGLPDGSWADYVRLINRPEPDPAEQRAIERCARELAADGFDELDPWAREWIECLLDDDLSTSIVRAAIAWHRTGESEALIAALDRTRDEYVRENTELYREHARKERE